MAMRPAFLRLRAKYARRSGFEAPGRPAGMDFFRRPRLLLQQNARENRLINWDFIKKACRRRLCGKKFQKGKTSGAIPDII
jgi:hypothetical protein